MEIDTDKIHKLREYDKTCLLFFILGMMWTSFTEIQIETINKEVDYYATRQTVNN